MRGKKGETGSQPRRGKVECEPDFSRFFREGERERGGGAAVEQTSCSCPQTSSASMLFTSVLPAGLRLSLKRCIGECACMCVCQRVFVCVSEQHQDQSTADLCAAYSVD